MEKAGEGSGNGESEGAEREADNRAVGSKASATANSIGAEKKRSDIIIVTKKKTVLNPLKALLLLSSFKNPMIFSDPVMGIVGVDLRYKNGGLEMEEMGRKSRGGGTSFTNVNPRLQTFVKLLNGFLGTKNNSVCCSEEYFF